MSHHSSLLGIDIGGTKTALALVDKQGNIMRSISMDTEKTTALQWIDKLCVSIDKLIKDQSIEGIGIGIKGMVAADLKTVIHSSVIEDCKPVDICSYLSEKYQVLCIADNDVHAAAIAECKFGCGQQYDNFVYVNLGTGLAVGIVYHGDLIRGAGNLAGELGMTTEIRQDDGHAYQLETAVSGAGLVAEAERLHRGYPESDLNGRITRQEAVSTKEIVRAYKTGDTLAKAVMKQFIDTLLRILVNLSRLLNPKAFVFGGGLASDPLILQLIQREYETRCDPIYRAHILISALGGNETGVIGAASLCLSH